MIDTPIFFGRNRDLGTISVYIGFWTSAVNHPYMCIYRIYICFPLISTPILRGVIIIQQKNSFLGVIFDEGHDFEGPRAPNAHLDTVLTKPVTPLGHPL